MISALSVWSAYYFLNILGDMTLDKKLKGLTIMFDISMWTLGSIAILLKLSALFLFSNIAFVMFMFFAALLNAAISPPGPDHSKTTNSIAMVAIIKLAVALTCWTLI